MRRGQFEIMGLAIAVIIISLGVFFLLTFSLKPEPDLAGQFFEEQYAQNYVDALLKTSLEDCPGTVSDFFAEWAGYAPGTGPLTGCRSEETAARITQEIEASMQQYMNRPFRFELRREVCDSPLGGAGCDVVLEAESGAACDPATSAVGRPGRAHVSRYPEGFAEVVLWVCAPQ